MSNYEQLRSWINKRFPERLKLEFGVEVIFNPRTQHCTFTCLGKSEDYFTYWKDKGDEERCNFVVSERDGWVPDEILGKPLGLQDILRAIHSTGVFTEMFISSDGFLVIDLNIDTHVMLNLAIPLSHPDNNVAFGKLLALLTNNEDHGTT